MYKERLWFNVGLKYIVKCSTMKSYVSLINELNIFRAGDLYATNMSS